MDYVRLNNIVVFAHLGVSEAEREVGQRIRIDLELGAELERASQSDTLTDTISYELVYRALERVVETSRHKLLETLAGDLIKCLLNEFPKVQQVRIRVRKLNVPFAGTVSSAEVELARGR